MASILLIEDDIELASALSESLTLAGHQVTTALDGWSALRTLDIDMQIDLLLTDLVMPAGQPHGLALARMARHKRPGLAVIFMTGHAEFVDEAAGDKILMKPVRTAVVLDEIAASLHATG